MFIEFKNNLINIDTLMSVELNDDKTIFYLYFMSSSKIWSFHFGTESECIEDYNKLKELLCIKRL